MTDRTSEIKRVLITGAAGSSGRMLVDYLKAEHPHVEVHGAVRRKGRVSLPGVVLHEVDLLDTASIIACLRSSNPDAVFHTAANPDKCFETPSAVLTYNAVGTANLLEAVRLTPRMITIQEAYFYASRKVPFDESPVVVVVSSSEVYGDVRPEEVPIKEDCPLRPVSPYAVSKLAADHLARVYHKAYGMRTVVTRAFTYLNPLRPDLFASSFAKQIAEVEVGKRGVVTHGNLDSVRVVCDARDVMGAYWLAATRCRFGEAYNIAGDTRVTVGEVLRRLWGFSECGMVNGGKPPLVTSQDPALMRPVDVTLQVADTAKFRTETGWEPKFDLDRSLKDLLDHYRREVAR